MWSCSRSILLRCKSSKFDAKSGDRYHIFNETVSCSIREMWKMCTSLSAVALAKVGPRFSLTINNYPNLCNLRNLWFLKI